ncbi:MAG: hypothetical protein ACYDB1_06190 [Acidiferrobacteraceae bacterium]
MGKLLGLCLALGFLAMSFKTVLADTLESNTSAGPGSFSEDGIYHGLSKALRDSGNGTEWTVDTGYSRTSFAVRKGPAVVDITRSLTGTLGEERGDWRYGASYFISDTPAENLIGAGPLVYVGHTWEGSGNRPSLDLKIRYSSLNYRLDSHAGVLALGQDEAHVGTGLLWPMFSLYAGYGDYQYRHSVQQFNGGLRSSKTIHGAFTRLRAAIYGFPRYTVEGAATVSPDADWQFTLNEIKTDALIPRGTIYATQLLAAHEFGRWELDVGAERDLDIQFNQTMGLLNVSYHFDE